jgi:AcrR family transcriptional regulator
MSPSRRKYEMRERAKAYQATRQRILQATFELHRAKGVAATTYADVAARAGLAPATVIRHFPTMGALVSTCGAHVWQWLALPDPKQVFAGVGDPAERLRRLVHEVCGIYTRGEGPIQGTRNDRNQVPQLEQFLRQLDTALEQLVREALAPSHPSERVLQLILTVLDYGVWRSLRQRGLDEAAELVALLEFVVQPQSARSEGTSSQPSQSQDPDGSGASHGARLKRRPQPSRDA